MKKISIITLLSVATLVLHAQDIKSAKLSWVVSGLNDVKTEKTTAYNCVFVTDGGNDILWKQGGGSFILTLKVISQSGNWLDIRQPGKTVYDFSAEDVSGKLTIERTELGVVIKLESAGAGINHSYAVSEILTNNN